MHTSLHLLSLIISNSQDKSTHQSTQLNLAGAGSDFTLWILLVILSLAACLCLLNYWTLRSHRLSLAQLNSNRTFQLVIQNRSKAKCVFPGWARPVSHLCCKVGVVGFLYFLTSAANVYLVYCGLVLSVLFIAYNIKLLLAEVLNPRSAFHRRYLLFRTDPMFVRMRLFFDLGRRFLYFVVGFAFISYSLHRLFGDMFAFQNRPFALFVAHVQANFTGMTSLGSDPLIYSTTAANSLQLFRGIFSFLLLLTFVNLIASGLSSANAPQKKRRIRGKSKAFAQGLKTKDDVKAMVELMIEQYLEIPAKRIKLESDLVLDFEASPVEVAGLQAMFEEFLEQSIPPSANFDTKTKVGSIIEYFWESLQNQSNQLDFPIPTLKAN